MNWHWHLGRKKKEESNLKRDWMGGGGGGGGGPVPRDFTHNFCCYGNRSVCLYLLRATASSGATKSGSFGRALLERGEQAVGMFTPKTGDGGGGEGDRERRRVCKYALTLCLFSPGCRLGHICVQHWAQPPPEFQLELPGRATVLIKQKGLGQGSENSAVTASSMWRNYEMCLLPEYLFYVLWKK